MAYREVPQPDADCCLGGYCWRKYCPDRASMRRYIMRQALLRDMGALGGDAGDMATDIPELSDEDRD